MRSLISLCLAATALAAAAPSIPTLTLSYTGTATVSMPRILLGTGGGRGGYDVDLWLSAAPSGSGADTSSTYCYFTTPEGRKSQSSMCSQVAIANSLSAAGLSASSQFLVSKIEPEDFGVLEVLSGFGRAVDRGILLDMSISKLDALLMHQAGRSAGASNVRPACFNASAAASGEGTYAQCRLQTFLAFQALQEKGVVRSIGVSNWQIRDLQQVFAATGVYPSLLEVEVHPWWHEDELLDF